MDRVIKDYFDHYRGCLPPELRGEIQGGLLTDTALLTKWRNWKTGLDYIDRERNATLFGALDDCVVVDGSYAPLDYKTKGSEPTREDSVRYYQLQLDTYSLLLQENGYPAAENGYLVYYFPQTVRERGVVEFTLRTFEIQTQPDRARKTFEHAVDLLRASRIPPRHTRCDYCMWNEQLLEFE
ncbi:MAG: PD-(D/E)XK nuclease family protein [bacterium]